SSVYYGTNGGTVVLDSKTGDDFDPGQANQQDYGDGAPTPAGSGDCVVTKFVYDDGRLQKVYNNRNKYTQLTYDDLGRKTKVVENVVGTLDEADTDVNRTTEYVYDTKGRPSKIMAKRPKGDGLGIEDQNTRYVYGSTDNGSWPTAVVYPDSGNGMTEDANKVWTIDSGTDHVTIVYDRLGRRTKVTDQRTVEHTYVYDAAGRLKADQVSNSTWVTGVNANVKSISYTYDDMSRPAKVTSHSDKDADEPGDGNIVNQVVYYDSTQGTKGYGGWGNPKRSWQAHGGAADVDPAGGETPYVEYAYEDGGPGTGAAKYVRPDSVKYPSGRQVYYNYPSSGVGAGRALLRLD
ncbi:hypothetical protein LCGC14_3089720, partial [marine sediment metagenome]